jgi:hypothetical protein
MKGLSIVKRFAVAAVAAAALAGPVTAAHALQFGSGDAVLAVYGNNTEFVVDLGNFQTLLSTGVNLDLVSGAYGNVMAQVGGANTVKYTLFGGGLSSGLPVFFGSNAAIGTWTSSQKNGVLPSTLNNALINWSGNLAAASNSAFLFTATDALSFSTNLNNAGSDSLGGSVPSGKGGTAIDTTLNLLNRTGAASTLSQVGIATLSSSSGHFVVSAVPVPAAVVLFATGVIGLVGLARRRMSGAQPDAA